MLARKFVSIAVALLCAPACALALSGAEAEAAVTHKFVRAITEIPSAGPHGEPIPSSGGLSEVGSMTVDSGHLWIAEHVASKQAGPEFRVDEFDAASGAFLSQFPQVPGLTATQHGIAVGHLAGEAQVYVGGGSVVGSDGRVAVFSEAGAVLGEWSGAHTPGGTFGGEARESKSVRDIAVDGSVTDPAAGDVYVADSGQAVVDVFKPVVAGVEPPAENITQLTGTCPSVGTCAPSEVIRFTNPILVSVDASTGDVLVVDRTGSGHVVDVFEPQLLGGYSFLRQITGSPPAGAFGEVTGISVDPGAGDIYVADRSGQGPVVDEFSSAGVFRGRITGADTPSGTFGGPNGLAVDPVSHDVYFGNHDETSGVGVVDVFGGDLIIPDVVTELATGVTPVSGVVHGTVDPFGEGNASCVFVWGTTRAFGNTTACSAGVPNGNGAVGVSAELTGLLPDTKYFYRLRASNGNGTNRGEESQDGELVTSGPGISGESVSGVSSGSATFEARIDPHGAPTSYRFEYDTSPYVLNGPGHGTSTPVPDGALGSGEGGVQVGRHVQGLAASTVYHYRVVAVSELVGKLVEFDGPDLSFRTQAVGSALSLPDARRWELVSPVDKHGSVLLPISESGVVQASVSGGAMTYLGTVPTEAGVRGYKEQGQIFSTRGTSGWSSQDIALPHATPIGFSVGAGQEYRFFSDDLSLGMVEPFGEFTSLAPEVSPSDTERTPYLRHDSTCAATPGDCFFPLVTGAPSYADVPQGTKTNGEAVFGYVRFAAATRDLAHVVLTSQVALTSMPVTIPVGKASVLYEWSAGKSASEELRAVSVLPESEGGMVVNSQPGSAAGGAQAIDPGTAVSKDGSRVFWGYKLGNGEGLYLRDVSRARDVAGGESLRLDVVQGGSGTGPVEARFQAASGDGSRVFFTDEQSLTGNSGAQSGRADLYECVIVVEAGGDKCVLNDLTPAVGGEGASVQGVVGASEDGSYAYFVASGGVGAGENDRHEKPVLGADDLYMLHYNAEAGKWESPVLLGVLSSEDSPDWSLKMTEHTARVSPDGQQLAFMSNRPLTGYDNRDANSGERDEEVFLFDAAVGHLVCGSCNPTGARPVGVEVGNEGRMVVRSGGPASTTWLAANIPTWTPYQLGATDYQSRYLSDAGRLFFNSNDALVPQDINGNQDVYEFEPAGIGDCTSVSPTFSERTGGCVALVSSGAAVGESAFLDASENGDDVFFLTGDRLAPLDVDTALDVYDAHVCSSVEPCVSPVVSAPECTTADACRLAPLVQPGVFGSPSSATFSGAGNVTPASAGSVAKQRSLTRAQKLARALKSCHRKKGSRRRAACVRSAQKRFGASKSRVAAKGRGGR